MVETTEVADGNDREVALSVLHDMLTADIAENAE